MKRSAVKAKGIFTTRIVLARAFDVPKREQPAHDDDPDWRPELEPDPVMEKAWGNSFVTLREYTNDEQQRLALAKDFHDGLLSLLGDCIVEHNFEEDDGSASPVAEVVALIMSSWSATSYVLDTWAAASPLLKRSVARSRPSRTPLSSGNELPTSSLESIPDGPGSSE